MARPRETRADAVADAFHYIGPLLCNRRRRHSTMGHVSPQQFLNDRVKRQHEQELAAQYRRVGKQKTEGSSVAHGYDRHTQIQFARWSTKERLGMMICAYDFWACGRYDF